MKDRKQESVKKALAQMIQTRMNLLSDMTIVQDSLNPTVTVLRNITLVM